MHIQHNLLYRCLLVGLCIVGGFSGCSPSQPQTVTAQAFWPIHPQDALSFHDSELPSDTEPDSVLSDDNSSVSVDTAEVLTDTEEAAAKPAIVSTEEAAASILSKQFRHIRYTLPVPCLSQYPELPTGCEVTSLTMLLNYLGCDVDKTTIADRYLVYGDSFVLSYHGDPYEDNGAGIYPPGIIQTVANYAIQTDQTLAAVDLTGMSFRSLYQFLENGYPVMLWTTLRAEYPSFDEEIFEEYNGIRYPWYINEHCVLLVGYDVKSGTVSVNDPIYGEMTYDAAYYEEIYQTIGQFALTVLTDTF